MINEVGINYKCGGYLRLIPLVLLLVPPTLPLVPPGGTKVFPWCLRRGCRKFFAEEQLARCFESDCVKGHEECRRTDIEYYRGPS